MIAEQVRKYPGWQAGVRLLAAWAIAWGTVQSADRLPAVISGLGIVSVFLLVWFSAREQPTIRSMQPMDWVATAVALFLALWLRTEYFWTVPPGWGFEALSF